MKFYWAPDFVEFVLDSLSCFNIVIAYSNYTLCGAWTPSFCKFTWKLSTFQQNAHSLEHLAFTKILQNFRTMSIPPAFNDRRAVLVLVSFGWFSPSRFSHFHCNAMRKAIKEHKNLHTNQQNDHTLVLCFWGI